MNWTFHKKKRSLPNRYHEVDSFNREEGTFDEARYYEGDQFELGGVDFGFDRPPRETKREPYSQGEHFDYWDEGVGMDYSTNTRPSHRRRHQSHRHGWDRPGLHSNDYGFQGPAERFTPREPYFDRKGKHHGKGPKGYQRPDELILEEVSEALFKSGDVDAREIIVDVKDGYVYLRGSVEGRRTKKLAESCIENVPGVKDVMNELSIKEASRQEILTENEIQDLDRFRIA